jgi:hypothetical protein
MAPGRRRIHGIAKARVGIRQQPEMIQKGRGQGQQGVDSHDAGAPAGHAGGEGGLGGQAKNHDGWCFFSREINQSQFKTCLVVRIEKKL